MNYSKQCSYIITQNNDSISDFGEVNERDKNKLNIIVEDERHQL